MKNNKKKKRGKKAKVKPENMMLDEQSLLTDIKGREGKKKKKNREKGGERERGREGKKSSRAENSDIKIILQDFYL